MSGSANGWRDAPVEAGLSGEAGADAVRAHPARMLARVVVTRRCDLVVCWGFRVERELIMTPSVVLRPVRHPGDWRTHSKPKRLVDGHPAEPSGHTTAAMSEVHLSHSSEQNASWMPSN